MSTDPTVLNATEPALDIASIKEIMDGFDPASLLPELSSLLELAVWFSKFAIFVGPVILLVMGLAYLFLSPKEANYHFGYRCYYGMGSVESWQFTQKLAGIVLGALGLVLTGVTLIVSLGLSALNPMDAAWRAVYCLIFQAVLALLANGAIWGVTAYLFDAHGLPRRRGKPVPRNNRRK